MQNENQNENENRVQFRNIKNLVISKFYMYDRLL